MKLTDFILIFVIITLPFMLISNLKTQSANAVTFKKISMDRLIDTAAEDAASQMLQQTDDRKIIVDKEKAAQTFFNSIYVNMGIMGDKIKQKQVTGYVPILIVTDYTGYYVLSNERYTGTDGTEVQFIWHPKKTYACAKDNYVINFALDLNYVSIYDTRTKSFTEGTYDDIKPSFTESYIQDKDTFDQMRRNAIISSIQADVNECINKQNDIAKHFGIAYNFSLPNIAHDDWERSIDDYGVIAFMQGMPLGLGEYYNNFALGGARIYKKSMLFIQMDPKTGLKYYHREDCSRLTTKDTPAYDAKEAALEGALPCPECKP